MPRFRSLIIVCGIIALAAAAFAKRPPKPCPAPPEPGDEPAYIEAEVADPGTLSGRVDFKGEYTPMKWKVVKDRETCGDTVIDESLVAAADGGLRFVVVSIDDIKEGKALPREIKELANKDCRYQPHVEAISLCSKLMVTNHDPIFHNTHAYMGEGIFEPQKPELTHDGLFVIAYEETPTANKGPIIAFTTLFNLGLPTQDFKPKKTMRKPGLATLKCDAGHTWMTGYVWIKPHPYVAVTDAKGNFTITQIPAGEHTVTFWHEVLGTQEKKVNIKKDETATLNVTYTQK